MYTNAYEGAIRGVELNKLRFAVILASLMAFSVYLASSASADGFSVYDWVVKFNSVVFGFTGAQVAEDTTAVSSGATGSVATSGGGGSSSSSPSSGGDGGELAPVSGTNSSGGGGGGGSAVAKHPPCGSYGDVDGDGSVTNADAELVSSYAAKLAALTDSQLKLADVNADGVVNVVDSLFIAQYLNNLRETFTVCQRKPDLAISEINVYPESGIFEGTEVIFEIIIKNVGAAATVDYSFSYDYGEGVGAGLAYPLNFDAGGSKAERVTHAYNAAGTYIATFSVGASDDSNMANNKAVKSVTVNKAAEVIACTESDNGLDYYVAGKTTGKLLNMDGFSYDYCSEGGVDERGNPVNLVEFYCINSTDYAPKPYYCPNGCKDGACLNEAVPVKDAAEASLKLGGRSYKIRSASDSEADFPVFVDYNGDGAFNAHLPITGRESDSISKNTYFYLWGYGVMQYSGASSFTSASPVIRFRDVKAGTLIEEPYWLKSGSVVIATLKMGGKEYNVSASDTSSADFVIRVDMDGSGVIGDGNENIINNEVAPVQRNDYVYLVGWGDLVRYKGASAFSDSLHTMRFQDVSTGNLLEIAYSVVNETETPHCTDSDGGKNYYQKGVTEIISGEVASVAYDKCDASRLTEYSCYGNEREVEVYDCPYGCKDGACVEQKSFTLSEGETKTYTLGGRDYEVTAYFRDWDYEVTADFVGITTVRFKVNGQLTPSLVEGGSFVLADGVKIGIVNIVTESFAGGVKTVSFTIIASVEGNLYEGEAKTYTLNSYDYDVRADFIGSTTVRLSVNGELTPPLSAPLIVTDVNGEAWRVGTSAKKLEFSERLSAGSASAKQETIRNITTFITDDELPALLADGAFRNSKGDYNYHQYVYFDNVNTQTTTSPASLSVIYAEDPDTDVTADYFYVKNGDRIARYSLEFTTPLESDITDSTGAAATTGTYLWDLEGKEINLLGKSYSIVQARRSNSNGNGAELTLMHGSTKIFLKDTDIASIGTGSQSLEINSERIDDTMVTITGSDDNITFSIDTIELNITADDDFYVPAGGKLSGQFEKPDALLSSWDIAYAGLEDVPSEKIRIKTSSSNQYYLEFVDGSGNRVSVPLAYTSGGSNLTLGDNTNALVISENTTIARNDYFLVTDISQQQGDRRTYAVRYKGASAFSDSSPVIKFQILGESGTKEEDYSAQTGDAVIGSADAVLNLGGAAYRIWNVTPDTSSDFSIVIDLNGNGVGDTVATAQNLQTVNTAKLVNVTTRSGAQILIRPFPLASSYLKLTNAVPMTAVNISIQTPNADDYDNIAPTPVDFYITAASGIVKFAENNAWHGDHNYLSPQGESNTNYAYTSLGAKVKWDNPSNYPDTLEIDYPTVQRLPLVYITAPGAEISTGETEGSSFVLADGAKIGIVNIGVQDYAGGVRWVQFTLSLSAKEKPVPPFPPDESFAGTVYLSPGWNLIGTFLLDDDANVKTDCDKSGNVQAAYYYDPVNRRYVDLLAAEAGDTEVEVETKKDTLNEGETKTYTVGGKDYEVSAGFVGSTSAKLIVNGQITPSLAEGGSFVLADGASVKILNIMAQDFAGGVRNVEFVLIVPAGSGYLTTDKINSFWIKVADGCKINFEIDEPYGWLNEVGASGKKLARGWNFLSVIPEMAGRNIGSLDGTCSFTHAYRFDQESQSWQNIRDVTFSWEMVGVGYAAKVADECFLEGITQEDGPAATPPELPAE